MLLIALALTMLPPAPVALPPSVAEAAGDATVAGYANLQVRYCGADCRAPREAIDLAAAAAPARGPTGFYAITVRAAGTHGGRFYLNSERDYRDQRNISLSFDADEARQLIDLLDGQDVARALIGRQLVVYGRPERVRIAFLSDGRPTGLYYFQTHIVIHNAVNQVFPPPV